MKKTTCIKDALMTGLTFVLLVLALCFVVVGTLPVLEVQAELTKDRHETLSGWSLNTANGNATGGVTGTKLYRGSEFPEAFSCYAYVANVAGSAMANTATFNLEGSTNNSVWGILKTVSLTASTVTAFSNTTATAPAARYYRTNVTAIQNSDSYVTVDCLFE